MRKSFYIFIGIFISVILISYFFFDGEPILDSIFPEDNVFWQILFIIGLVLFILTAYMIIFVWGRELIKLFKRKKKDGGN